MESSVLEKSQTQPCVRCGAPVSLQEALCERCNPLGLAQPSASQAHGTVFLGIGVAVLLLASLAGGSAKGVGPFTAQISAPISVPDGLSVEIIVENTGSGAGSAACSVSTTKIGSAGLTEMVTTKRIDPGSSVVITRELKAFGAEPIPLQIDCGS